MRIPFTVDDLYLHRKVTSVHCIPTLDVAVCSVRSVDRDNDTYHSALWLQPLDGSPGQPLGDGDFTDTSPRWSPAGDRIAFTSSRGENGVQVHVIAPDGSGLRAVSDLPSGVSSLRWMPDGQRLVITAAVTVDPDLRGGRSTGPAPLRADKAPEVAWRLPYKADGVGYLLQREIALYVLDVDSGRTERLTDGPFDVMAFDVSADGSKICYSRTRDGRFAHRTDLWVCDLTTGQHRQLTHDHATVMQPMWSPDGRHIAFTGAILEGDSESRLWCADAGTGRVRAVCEVRIDVADPESLHWQADGKSLVFVRAHRSRHHIVSVDVDAQTVEVLLEGDRQLGAFALTDQHVVFSVEHPSVPSELWCADRATAGERKLTSLNAWWDERLPVHVETRSFDVPDGRAGTESIEGWLLRSSPTDVPKPLLNDMHGGPAAYALLDFDTNVFWQVMVSQGWVVLALNAVGSATYGREFCQRLAGHWGELDLPQHLAAVEQLKREGVCTDDVAVSGKSYGGYLSSWAVGHTDVFRAAVVMAPVGNIETHYGTSDGGYYADPLYVATAPRFDRKRARELSPLHAIDRSRTPTLFLQGKEDERCPKCQSEEMFVSMMRAGDTPAELVLYPGENHLFLGEGAPSCRADAANRIIDWVVKHALEQTAGDSEGARATAADSDTEELAAEAS